jgi:hypothetical protein
MESQLLLFPETVGALKDIFSWLCVRAVNPEGGDSPIFRFLGAGSSENL